MQCQASWRETGKHCTPVSICNTALHDCCVSLYGSCPLCTTEFAAKVCTKQWNWSYEELLHTLQPPSLQVRHKRMKLVKYINNMAYFSEPPLVQRQMCYSTRVSHSIICIVFVGMPMLFFHFFPQTVYTYVE